MVRLSGSGFSWGACRPPPAVLGGLAALPARPASIYLGVLPCAPFGVLPFARPSWRGLLKRRKRKEEKEEIRVRALRGVAFARPSWRGLFARPSGCSLARPSWRGLVRALRGVAFCAPCILVVWGVAVPVS